MNKRYEPIVLIVILFEHEAIQHLGEFYTDNVSKLDFQARRRPEFLSDIVGAEAVQLERVGRCRRVEIQWQADEV